ncbi:MAG: DUF202 domain-containing protein [Rhodanobacter sp.]
MPQPAQPDDASWRLVCLAAERTLTSWIRTALSLMALGFVIDRFDLVLRGMASAPPGAAATPRALWQWGGSILIAASALMALAAGGWYLRLALSWQRGPATDVRALLVGSLFSLLLGLGGVALIVMLTAALR